MKVIILAGGYATRLHPLTLNQAKPLLKVAGKPMVEHIINKLNNFPEINDIFIVTNQKFHQDFEQWNSNFTSTKSIKIINDGTTSNDDRLGAIGDIQFTINQENIDDDLLIVAGDNLFEDNLISFMSHFNEKGSSILVNDVGCFEKAKNFGIVEKNETHQITSFLEKPEQPPSTLAATCIYAIKKEHLPHIEGTINKGFQDRPGDFIKHLSENEHVSAIALQGKWFDIGSLDSLNEANEVYRNEN